MLMTIGLSGSKECGQASDGPVWQGLLHEGRSSMDCFSLHSPLRPNLAVFSAMSHLLAAIEAGQAEVGASLRVHCR